MSRGARGGCVASSDLKKLERETGFEPATSTLARSHSTTELFPPAPNPYRTTRPGLACNGLLRPLQILHASRSTRAASSGDVGLM